MKSLTGKNVDISLINYLERRWEKDPPEWTCSGTTGVTIKELISSMMALPSRPNHLPEIPSPNTNPLGIWFQCLNLRGTHSVYSTFWSGIQLIVSSVFSYTTQEKQKIKLKTLYPTLNICLYLFYFVMFIQKKCWWQYNNLGLWLMFSSLKSKLQICITYYGVLILTWMWLINHRILVLSIF